MTSTTDISQPIIEALYGHSLVLADEVRAVFGLSTQQTNAQDLANQAGDHTDARRIAMSVEGLRTTTRVMHVLAWLLNHRAFLAGDMSEFQLRRHGVLPADRASDPANLELLDDRVRELVSESEKLHARVARLDSAWHESFAMDPPAVVRLSERMRA